MKIQLENSSSIPTLTQIALAGTGSGIVSSYVSYLTERCPILIAWSYSIVTTPTELIKIRQQSLLVPSSTYEVILDILRKNGIRGLYRGMTATALRDLGYGSYFFAVHFYVSLSMSILRDHSTKQLPGISHQFPTRLSDLLRFRSCYHNSMVRFGHLHGLQCYWLVVWPA